MFPAEFVHILVWVSLEGDNLGIYRILSLLFPAWAYTHAYLHGYRMSRSITWIEHCVFRP